MLLAAVDPTPGNRTHAARSLLEFVAAKRRAVHGVAQRAVLAAGEGAGVCVRACVCMRVRVCARCVRMCVFMVAIPAAR